MHKNDTPVYGKNMEKRILKLLVQIQTWKANVVKNKEDFNTLETEEIRSCVSNILMTDGLI